MLTPVASTLVLTIVLVVLSTVSGYTNQEGLACRTAFTQYYKMDCFKELLKVRMFLDTMKKKDEMSPILSVYTNPRTRAGENS